MLSLISHWESCSLKFLSWPSLLKWPSGYSGCTVLGSLGLYAGIFVISWNDFSNDCGGSPPLSVCNLQNKCWQWISSWHNNADSDCMHARIFMHFSSNVGFILISLMKLGNRLRMSWNKNWEGFWYAMHKTRFFLFQDLAEASLKSCGIYWQVVPAVMSCLLTLPICQIMNVLWLFAVIQLVFEMLILLHVFINLILCL